MEYTATSARDATNEEPGLQSPSLISASINMAPLPSSSIPEPLRFSEAPSVDALDPDSFGSSLTPEEIIRAGLDDPHPSITNIGMGVFKVEGRTCPIYVTPDQGHCSACGLRKNSSWCPHLISAGLRCVPPVLRGRNSKVYLCPLSRLEAYQKLSNARSGRKKPRYTWYQFKIISIRL